MKTSIILGLGFGDEGKGVTTDYLCRQAERPLVVRFSGGHQAGHTVVSPEGIRHVFSSFGAGTLAGAATFWSRYCTFYPVAYRNELRALLEKGINPELFVDGRSPVTTPYDVLANQSRESQLRHGSCGVGFGSTLARQEGPHKLHVMDLLDEFILDARLASVATYYSARGISFAPQALEEAMAAFRESINTVRDHLRVVNERGFFQGAATSHDAIIFEGSQGILLDQEFGYFPHVTRAHVTSKHALEIIERNQLAAPGIHYVTRAYQTRHGNGPLKNEFLSGPALTPTPYETNTMNPWQGAQRRSLLDMGQLRYALSADAHYSAGLPRTLVVTCLDQLIGPWRATDGEAEITLRSLEHLACSLGNFREVLGNYGQVGQLKNQSSAVTTA
jgi:adenylosuccinate synthase